MLHSTLTENVGYIQMSAALTMDVAVSSLWIFCEPIKLAGEVQTLGVLSSTFALLDAAQKTSLVAVIDSIFNALRPI